jgi:hypothetical protein
MAVAIAAAACSSASSTATANANLPVAGCGSTSANLSAPPAWAGSADAPAGVATVLSEEGNAAAFVFGAPLQAGVRTDGRTNKILWIVREPRNGVPLDLTGGVAGAAPTVSRTFEANGGPGEIYSTVVDVPAPGCWHLTLRWGPNIAHVSLEYGPASGAASS